MKEQTYVLGFDIGGTKIAICVGDEKGNIISSKRLKGGTRQEYKDILPELVSLANQTVSEAGMTMEDIDIVGLSCPGPLNINAGILEQTPNMVWKNIPIREDIARELGIHTVMQNDANGGALAEWFFGAGRGYHELIYMTMSTGIGGGIIAEDTLLEGETGNAGEIGHVVLDVNGPPCGCGMNGCFEAFCGGRNVADQLRSTVRENPDHPLLAIPGVDGSPENLRYETLRTGVEQGIPEAEKLWENICMRFAQGIGVQMMTFNPALIILGTTFYYSGDLLLNPVKRYLPQFCWSQMLESCEIKLPELGSQVGEMSGIAVGLYDIMRQK